VKIARTVLGGNAADLLYNINNLKIKEITPKHTSYGQKNILKIAARKAEYHWEM
jgi:hypothetical protein